MIHLGRFARTIAHLPASQILALGRHRLRKWLENPASIERTHCSPHPGCVWRPMGAFLPPLQKNTSEQILAGQMEFLRQPISIGWPPDWNHRGASRLWLYNLHYFDHLWALKYPDAIRLASDWIDQHRPARGAIGWEPYPTSLRLINWCCVFFGRFRAQIERDEPACEKIWQSICRQANWLDAHQEWHLRGNHLLENACALTVVGSCFGGAEARQWFESGMRLLRSQLSEQFRDDGTHEERSPMYHSRMVYLLLLLSNLGREELTVMVRPILKMSTQALVEMTHPDGRLALLNDSAWQVYNSTAELAQQSHEPAKIATGPFALPDAGYFGFRGDDGSYLICNAGNIGPEHQPGHAHGDSLSFELSLKGHRFIVDSGVHDYEPGRMRDYCRSTRAHNTIEIAEQDQSEFWGVFRVGRRARVSDVRFSPSNDGFELNAMHDGYRHLKGSPTHRRRFNWQRTGRLDLHDTVVCRSRQTVVSRLHLHSDCSIVDLASTKARVRFAGGLVDIVFDGPGHLAVEESFFCPRFGEAIRNQALAFTGNASGETNLNCRIELAS